MYHAIPKFRNLGFYHILVQSQTPGSGQSNSAREDGRSGPSSVIHVKWLLEEYPPNENQPWFSQIRGWRSLGRRSIEVKRIPGFIAALFSEVRWLDGAGIWWTVFCTRIGATSGVLEQLWEWSHWWLWQTFPAFDWAVVPASETGVSLATLPTTSNELWWDVPPSSWCEHGLNLNWYPGIPEKRPGWWFGTFFYFSIIYGNFIIPTDELIFFKMVGIPPTVLKSDRWRTVGAHKAASIASICSSASLPGQRITFEDCFFWPVFVSAVSTKHGNYDGCNQQEVDIEA